MVVHCCARRRAHTGKCRDCANVGRDHMGLCILWSCDSHHGTTHKYRLGSVYICQPSHHRWDSHQRVYTTLQSHSCSYEYICTRNHCSDLSVQTVYPEDCEIVSMWTLVERNVFYNRTFRFSKEKMEQIRSTCTHDQVSSLSNGRWHTNDPKSRKDHVHTLDLARAGRSQCTPC